MASFEIIASRRLSTENCEFDVASISGTIAVGDLFPIEEHGSLWEYIIFSAQEHASFTTLSCVTWLPENGAFVGYNASTRRLKAKDKKRYSKLLAGSLTSQSS